MLIPSKNNDQSVKFGQEQALVMTSHALEGDFPLEDGQGACSEVRGSGGRFEKFLSPD